MVNDKIEIVLTVDGKVKNYFIDIEKDMKDFVDIVLDKFDMILRDYVTTKEFKKNWDDTSEAEKVVADSIIEGLSK